MLLRRCIFFSLLLLSLCARAQSDSAWTVPDTTPTQLAIIAGAGNYEYLHAGVDLLFVNKIYFEAALGIKPWGFKNNLYTMAELALGTRILKRKEGRLVEPSLHLKGIAWYFNNEYNRFFCIATGAEVRLSFRLNEKLNLLANGGVVYNSVPYYERKTYREVGWPKEWQPSFSLQICYWIK